MPSYLGRLAAAVADLENIKQQSLPDTHFLPRFHTTASYVEAQALPCRTLLSKVNTTVTRPDTHRAQLLGCGQ